jgi:osmotically-inducible protein OsmY
MFYKKMLTVLAAAACAGLAGCDNTAQGVKEDAKENTAKVEQEAAEAKAETADERAEIKQDVKEAGREVGNAAEKTGDAVVEAAKDAGEATHAAKQTLDVKGALLADASVDASHIDVDTDGNTKTVTLKGTVPNAAQKATAERIARDKAEGYKIRNQLTVKS